MSERNGTIKALAYRPGRGAPMVQVRDCQAIVGRGFDGDDRAEGKRGVTLLSAEAWNDAVKELDPSLPWHTRRANILVEGMELSGLIGKRVRIGGVELRIWNETKPCQQMDDALAGLRRALKPDMRAGVHGEVVAGGVVRVNDAVQVVSDP